MARRPRPEAPPGLRYCMDCGQFKPVEDFYWNKTHGCPASMGKPCNRLRTRLRKERYPGQKLDADLRRAGSSFTGVPTTERSAAMRLRCLRSTAPR